MLTIESFLADIDDFLARTKMSASAFGRAAVGDPNLISDMKAGRMPTLRLVSQVQKYMAKADATAATGAAR